MDYPCAKFDFIVSAVLVLSCGQTDNQYTEADQRYTHATPIGVSNNLKPLYNRPTRLQLFKSTYYST